MFTPILDVSAFGGQGKINGLNLINKSHEYRQLFTSFGLEWHVTENVFQRVQAFICNMYCSNTNTKLVNKLRYEMFCAKNGDIHMWPKLWTHLTKTSLFKVKRVIAV